MWKSANPRFGHLRQMEIFGMNQGRFIDGYSEEFLKDFLNLMAGLALYSC